jgi:hypothetical protein
MATTSSRNTPRIVVLRMALELISDTWCRSWRGMLLDFLDDAPVTPLHWRPET